MVAGREGVQQDQGMVTKNTLQPDLKIGEIKIPFLCRFLFRHQTIRPSILVICCLA